IVSIIINHPHAAGRTTGLGEDTRDEGPNRGSPIHRRHKGEVSIRRPQNTYRSVERMVSFPRRRSINLEGGVFTNLGLSLKPAVKVWLITPGGSGERILT